MKHEKMIASLMIISTLLLSTSCAPTVKKMHTKADDYGCLTVLNTHWGMSLEECMNALGLNDNDILKESQSESTKVLKSEARIYNKKADLYFFIHEEYGSQNLINLGLVQVKVFFQETIDFEFLENEVRKEYQSNNTLFNVHRGNDSISLINDNSISALDEDLREQYVQLQITLGAQDYEFVQKHMFQSKLSSVGLITNDGKNATSMKYTGIEAALINYLSKSN